MKVKDKFQHITCHEDTKGSTLSLTLALDEGWWSAPRPDHFIFKKDSITFVKEAGGIQVLSGRV
jgi:hypothetical protein